MALSVQAFALLGTLIGAFTISVGVGPQTQRMFDGPKPAAIFNRFEQDARRIAG